MNTKNKPNQAGLVRTPTEAPETGKRSAKDIVMKGAGTISLIIGGGLAVWAFLSLNAIHDTERAEARARFELDRAEFDKNFAEMNAGPNEKVKIDAAQAKVDKAQAKLDRIEREADEIRQSKTKKLF